MNPTTLVTSSPINSNHRKLIVKGALRISLSLLIQVAILFLSSGRLDWIMAWVWLSVFLICIGINQIGSHSKSSRSHAERGNERSAGVQSAALSGSRTKLRFGTREVQESKAQLCPGHAQSYALDSWNGSWNGEDYHDRALDKI